MAAASVTDIRKRFIEIEQIVGHERFRDWFLEALEHYHPRDSSQMELRKHVLTYVEKEYKSYEADVEYKIMTQMGGRQDE